MRANWANIFGLFFLILVIVLIAKSHFIHFFSRSIENFGEYHDNPLYGLACIGIICITIVGIFAINSNRKH
jgi:hypothetical protein